MWRITSIALLVGLMVFCAASIYQSGRNAEQARNKSIADTAIEKSIEDQKGLSNANDFDLCRELNADCLPIWRD